MRPPPCERRRRRGRAHRAPAILAALVGAGQLAGCGVLSASGSGAARRGPPAPAAAAPSPAAIARADRTHELAGPASPQLAAGGWRKPVAAVTGFTEAYINWTATSVVARLRALAAVSVGQARATLTVQAEQAASDSTLRASAIVNSGAVEAVAQLAGAPNRYAVVTRERTAAPRSSADAGLAPAWHIALATVVREPDGLWTLSGWQPES